jgi:hypothetical protein
MLTSKEPKAISFIKKWYANTCFPDARHYKLNFPPLLMAAITLALLPLPFVVGWTKQV